MFVRLTSRFTKGLLGNVEEALSTLRHTIRTLIKDTHESRRYQLVDARLCWFVRDLKLMTCQSQQTHLPELT